MIARTLLAFCLVACSASSLIASDSANHPTTEQLRFKDTRVRIAVLGAEDLLPASKIVEEERHTYLPGPLVDAIIEALQRKQRFNIVEREVIRRAFNEQQFAKSATGERLDQLFKAGIENINDANADTIHSLQAVALGADGQSVRALSNSLGADYLVYGKLELLEEQPQTIPLPGSSKKLHAVQSNSRLHLRIIDVAKGIVAASQLVNTRSLSSPIAASDGTEFLRLLANDIAQVILKHTFEPQIISIDPPLINRGEVDEVSIGQAFAVYRPGAAVAEQNGTEIGRLKRPLGLVTVTAVASTFAEVEYVGEEDLAAGDTLDLRKTPGTAVATRNSSSTTKPATAAQTVSSASTTDESSFEAPPTLAIAEVLVRSLASDSAEFTASIPERLRDSLVVQLQSAFTILERGQLDAVLDETSFAAFTKSGDASLLADITKLSTADQILLISLNEFGVSTARRQIALLDETEKIHTAAAEASYRLVDRLSGNVIKAGEVSVRRSGGAAQQRPDMANQLLKEIGLHIAVDILGKEVKPSGEIETSSPKVDRDKVKVRW